MTKRQSLNQLPKLLEHIFDIEVEQVVYDGSGYYFKVGGEWRRLSFHIPGREKLKNLKEEKEMGDLESIVISVQEYNDFLDELGVAPEDLARVDPRKLNPKPDFPDNVQIEIFEDGTVYATDYNGQSGTTWNICSCFFDDREEWAEIKEYFQQG